MATPAPAPATPNPEQVAFEHSSWLAYGNYDSINLRLEIGFKSGRIVQHWPVYPQTWLDMKLSPSKGHYYSQAIAKTSAPIEIKAAA